MEKLQNPAIIILMIEEFLTWLSTNSDIYKALEDSLPYLRKDARCLVIGPYGILAAKILTEVLECGEVEIICKDEEALDALRRDIDPRGDVKIVDSPSGTYNFVFAPMYINYIEKSDFVSLLFDIMDALEPGGIFSFSFHDSPVLKVMELTPVPLWFCEKEVPTRFYTLQDVLNALTVTGYKILSLDEVKGEGIIHAASLNCFKRK